MLDRAQLESLSCECCAVVRKETDLLLHCLPQPSVITNSDSIPAATLPVTLQQHQGDGGNQAAVDEKPMSSRGLGE